MKILRKNIRKFLYFFNENIGRKKMKILENFMGKFGRKIGGNFKEDYT
jgi:hypothetical protein